MSDELFIVTSADGETRWAYTTKEVADKANDEIQPVGFHERLVVEKYVKAPTEKMEPCGCFVVRCSEYPKCGAPK